MEEDKIAPFSESDLNDMNKSKKLQQIEDPKLQNIVSALVDGNEETDAKAYSSESELNPSDISVEVSDAVNQRLKDAIQNYFCDEQSEEPQKLVYFLNHQYPEHGLQLSSLKGTDRINVAALLNVAKSLHLVFHLALAEVQQSFSRCEISDKDENSENYDQGNIYSSETIFYHWVDVSNRKVDYCLLKVAENEICWAKSIPSFEPLKTEHGRYMDDNRKDFLYRRAAVVLWAESRQTAMNFLLNSQDAILELFQLTREPGNENMVIDMVHKAGQYLTGKYHYGVEQFILLADIALYVQDKNIAMEVLSNFSRSVVRVSTVEILAKLQNEFGVDWFIDILEKWGKDKLYSSDIDQVDDFIHAFLENKGDLKIAELLLKQQSVAENRVLQSDAPFYLGSEGKLEKLIRIFKACDIISNVSILHRIIESVKANYKKYPVLDLVGLFLKLRNEISQNFYAHFDVLKVYLVNAINDELIHGKDLLDNWSLEVSRVSCHCNTCSEVIRFLTSKTEVRSYPFQAKKQGHVRNKLGNSHLPIAIINEKNVSPYEGFFFIEKKHSMHAKTCRRYAHLLYCKEAMNDHQF